ncbi:MAG: hypothetical protein QF781_05145 [Phycisphaerales bacterium]|jgi:hypothetical protein|nr:hypothetical protein [Phycisphaerales bacterium]
MPPPEATPEPPPEATPEATPEVTPEATPGKETEEISESPPQSVTRTLGIALLGAAIALILLTAVGWWLAGLTPRWYQPTTATDAAASELGETAEYRLVEEFQKIRPEDDVWRLRIPEEAVNAWLATRLPQWLSGQGTQWPVDLTPPQIHITPTGIEVAIASDDFGSRIGRFQVRPIITNNQLAFESPTLRVGRLPLPLPTSWIHPTLQDALAQAEDLAFLATLLQGDLIDAKVPLVDHRHVRLHAITLESGTCVLQASTSLSRD